MDYRGKWNSADLLHKFLLARIYIGRSVCCVGDRGRSLFYWIWITMLAPVFAQRCFFAAQNFVRANRVRPWACDWLNIKIETVKTRKGLWSYIGICRSAIKDERYLTLVMDVHCAMRIISSLRGMPRSNSMQCRGTPICAADRVADFGLFWYKMTGRIMKI